MLDLLTADSTVDASRFEVDRCRPADPSVVAASPSTSKSMAAGRYHVAMTAEIATNGPWLGGSTWGNQRTLHDGTERFHPDALEVMT